MTGVIGRDFFLEAIRRLREPRTDRFEIAAGGGRIDFAEAVRGFNPADVLSVFGQAARLNLTIREVSLPHQPAIILTGEFPGPAAPDAGRKSETYHVGGRAATWLEALIACVMEAVETMVFLDCPGRHPESTGAPLLGLASLLPYSDHQLSRRVCLENEFECLSPFIDPDASLRDDALAFTDFASGRPVHIPADACYLNRRVSTASGPRKIASSNGLAAGFTPSQATESAIFELIERDAVAIWWYNRIPFPALTYRQVMTPAHAQAVAEYERNSRRTVRLFNVTHDLGVPVCVAASWRADGEQLCIGAAAARNLSLAAFKAFTEMLQHECDMHRILRCSTATGRQMLAHRTFWGTSVYEALSFLTEKQQSIENGVPSGPVDPSRLSDRLKDAGIGVLIHQYPLADSTIHVTKALAPGLRHWTPWFGPGRLYDVPLRMGWISGVRRESGLNRIPLLL